MTRTFTIALLLLFQAPYALAADWQLRTIEDAITDQTRKEAYIVAPSGESLTIMRKTGGRVWGYISLVGTATFSPKTSLILRVDKEQPEEFDDSLDEFMKRHGMSERTWEWNPNLIGIDIWHGSAEKGCSQIIRQLFHGQQLIIRYNPSQSTTRDIVFTQLNNQQAISEALDFDLSTCE